MEKWPEALRKDMEEVFKTSPGFLEILKEEKDFEDLMNKQNNKSSSNPTDKDPIN